MGNHIQQKDIKLFLLFFAFLLGMILYFSYEATINEFVFSQRMAVYCVILVLTTISYVTVLYITSKENWKIENIFLIIAIIFSVFMYLAMPMTRGHDEQVHGYRIYEYANGKLINNGVSVSLSKGIIETFEDKYYYKEIFYNDNSYDTNIPEITYEFRMSSYSPISYIPHIAGVLVSNIFTSNSMIQVYVARLFNMIVCISILYFAIKMIPFGKNMLFLISLIPIAVEGYISLSADGLAIASTMLLISYILKLKYDENSKIGWKQIIILTILSIIVSISKIVYLPIVLLISILPKEKFKNNKKWIILLGIFIISFVIDLLWYRYGIQRENLINVSNNAWENIFKEPLLYIQKILYSIVLRFNIYINELFGGKLEYNENIVVSIFPYILLIVSLFISRKGKEKIQLSTFEKLVILFIIISVIILVFTAMYTEWSRLDINYIEGVQGRYFLPILPLCILLLSKGFLDDEKVTKKIAILITIMQIFVIAKIFIFHI